MGLPKQRRAHGDVLMATVPSGAQVASTMKHSGAIPPPPKPRDAAARPRFGGSGGLRFGGSNNVG